MSKSRARGQRGKSAQATARADSGRPAADVPARKTTRFRLAACLVAGIAVVGFSWHVLLQRSPSSARAERYRPRPKGSLTFNKDVARIVYSRCAGCHRPEEAAPFSLLTYAQVQKRARQIAEATARRYMPPWPPEPGYGDFADERRLSADELGIIQQWAAEGASEGKPSDLPPPPQWTDGWQLGEPDLTVTIPAPYQLSAEGKDVYENFVCPIPIPRTRFVRAVQLRTGNPSVVHHAFIEIDETRQSRRLAATGDPPGFGGMELPSTAIMPAGQFLGWQPGKSLYRVPEGLAWVLKTNTDLVLQMHMHPSGKPEQVRPSVGFYFTDQAPTNLPFRLRLVNDELDIPPGADNYVIERAYTLPVDLTLLRANPHAHYLGKDLQGYALLPNGERKWLLRIKDWDFNWQGDYQYARPIELPKGARVFMRFTYDNSTNNVRNPNQPPRRVRHGLNTTDEMAALGFQVLAKDSHERDLLARDYQQYLAARQIEYLQFRLRIEPNDDKAHTELAAFLGFQGKREQALRHLNSALKANPNNDQAHYQLGYLFLLANRTEEALREFQTVVRLNPHDSQAFGNLGIICLRQRRWVEAEDYLTTALHLNPDDQLAQQNLRVAINARAAR